MLGVALALIATLGFGAAFIFARLGMLHVRSTSGTIVSLVSGTIVAMALAFSLHRTEVFALGATAFAWFLLSGSINFPVARLLNYTSVSMAGVSRASPVLGASPLFSMALAVVVLDETLTLMVLAGTLLTVAGLVLILSER